MFKYAYLACFFFFFYFIIRSLSEVISAASSMANYLSVILTTVIQVFLVGAITY